MDDESSYKTYVPDASVLVKWFNDEKEDRKQADQLEQDYRSSRIDLLIPAFASWELGNFLGRVFEQNKALTLFSIFKNYSLRHALLTLEASSLAFSIMKTCPQTSFYDASYHALALEKDITLLTADKKYYEKAKKLGHIQLLKDYR